MVTQSLRGAVGRLLDGVLPPTCPGCGDLVAEPQTLCSACWWELTFLAGPCCAACGHPFEYAIPELSLCGTCAAKRPPFGRARAALLYDDASKGFILRFKHADRTDMAGLLAKWLWAAGTELLADADVLVPVPLHWSRRLARRYNQAALLALALGRLSGVAVDAKSLVRVKRTPSQGTFNLRGRARNVQGAFGVAKGAAGRIAGRRVVLIDDVFTTGATAKAAARTLKRAGAAGVDVLCVARVVKD